MFSRTKDRINSQIFDEIYINKILQQCDDVLIFMKSVHPSKLPRNIKPKLYCLSERSDYLLSCWDIYEKQIFSETKIDESLWLDNVLLKYLFEHCISYVSNSTDSRDLFCSVCDTRFDCSSSALEMHLKGETHISCYNIFRSQQKDKLWNDSDIYRWAFERYIDFRPDKTLYCKLCGVVITFDQVNLVSHFNGTKHMQKFKSIVNVKLIDNHEELTEDNSKSDNLLIDLDNKTDSKKNSGKSVKKTYEKDNNKSKQNKKSLARVGPGSCVTNFNYFDPYAKTEISSKTKSENALTDANCIKQATEKASKKTEISVNSSWAEGKRIDKKSDNKNLSDTKSGNNSRSRSISNSDTNPANRKPMSLKDIESHGVFMNKVISQNSSKVKLFCQPCGYSEVSSSDDAIQKHVSSLKHQQYMELKKNLAFLNFQSYYCQFCNIELICCEDFMFYHDKSKQHKQMCQISSKNKLPIMKKGTESNPSTSSCSVVKPTSRNSRKSAPSSPIGNVVKPKSKNIHKIHENCDSNILPKEMKSLLKTLLKSSVKKNIKNNLGFFCDACGFWTRKRNKWAGHIESNNHKQNMSFEPNHKLFNCDCCIVLICDDELYSMHVSSYVHQNLKSFVSQKSLIKNAEENLSAENSQTAGDQSNTPQKQIKKLHKSFFGFQISGLTTNIKESDISEAFSRFGEIEYVDFIEPNLADVCICLREDLKVGDVEKSTKQGLCFEIKGISCKIQEKNKCKLCDEIINDFSKDRLNLFEKLLSNSKKEFVSVIETPDGLFRLNKEAVEEDILKVCKQVKEVVTIGSRATGLLQSHSALDLFISMGDNFFGINHSSSETVSRLNEIVQTLNDSQPPVFKDVKVEGNIVIAQHISTGLNCRLIYDSGLLLANTEIIRLYVQADQRIIQLILIIKEWLKYTCLSELVSSYAITWLVLYYLMQPVVGMIKPVKELKDDCTKERMIVAGWDCTIRKFLNPRDSLKSDSKLTSIDEMLSGFFLFYGRDVDIGCVHCPLTGEMVSKTRFSNSEQVELNSVNSLPFTVTKGFCLQDPFELNKNLTENLLGPNLYKFREMCEEMVTILLNGV